MGLGPKLGHAAASNETRVRVDGFMKIIARVLRRMTSA